MATIVTVTKDQKGFGLSIRHQKVIKITPGGAASKAGLEVGHHLYAINGVSTEGKTHLELTNMIKQAGNSVDLQISKDDGTGATPVSTPLNTPIKTSKPVTSIPYNEPAAAAPEPSVAVPAVPEPVEPASSVAEPPAVPEPVEPEPVEPEPVEPEPVVPEPVVPEPAAAQAVPEPAEAPAAPEPVSEPESAAPEPSATSVVPGWYKSGTATSEPAVPAPAAPAVAEPARAPAAPVAPAAHAAPVAPAAPAAPVAPVAPAAPNTSVPVPAGGMKTLEGVHKCGSCGEELGSGVVAIIGDVTYHKACLICGFCGKDVSGGCTSKDGKLCCRECWDRSQGIICHGCNQAIISTEGKPASYKQLADKTFHPDCFACEDCKKPFGAQGAFPVGDGFFCKEHAMERLQGDRVKVSKDMGNILKGSKTGWR